MKKFLQEKWKTKDIEFGIFLLFLLGMAVYYGWRLFVLTPWYDELYTYYYFVSRGPIYAAIHWPLPNNHMGYSVLSGVLDYFGNSAIGLRGVSWISSLVSIGLLFAIGRKCFPKGFAMVPAFLFCAMGLVNQLAVQGRGYALTTCLYLVAFYELIQIIVEEKKENAIKTEQLLIHKLKNATTERPVGNVWKFGEDENREELQKKMSKLILSILMENWEKAEMLAEGIKQLVEEAPKEIKSAALRMKMAVQKEDTKKAAESHEQLQKMIEMQES